MIFIGIINDEIKQRGLVWALAYIPSFSPFSSISRLPYLKGEEQTRFDIWPLIVDDVC
jgi:hypothetical protein